jgi:hypothetical protein
MSSTPKFSASEVSKAVRLGGTLDSWKEIAFYLKREVRTVQRWEKKGICLPTDCSSVSVKPKKRVVSSATL